VIAIIHRLNDDDDKLVVVPKYKKEMTNEEIEKSVHFQEQFFKKKL
jgi:inorganic pyrophosphatase